MYIWKIYLFENILILEIITVGSLEISRLKISGVIDLKVVGES